MMEATISYLLMLQKYIYEIKDYALCLGNISKYFRINDMEKTGLKRSCKFFFS